MSTRSNTLALSALLATLAAAPLLMAQEPTSRERPSRDLEPGPASQQSNEPASSEMQQAGRDTMTDRSTDMSAQSFATQAATIGKAEIELGQLALKNSSDPNVKKFAQRMVTDHTAAEMKLEGVAAKDNLTLPKKLDAEHQALKDKLTPLKGKEFDEAYMSAMSKGHDKAVALFESVSQSTVQPDVKQFAASTLPTLKEHQQMAHKLHGGTQ